MCMKMKRLVTFITTVTIITLLICVVSKRSHLLVFFITTKYVVIYEGGFVGGIF